MRPKAEIILALDVDSAKQALGWVRRLYPALKTFKVGLQLYTACGPGIIRDIRKAGADVFLDLKLCDIPNTVANAVRLAARSRVKMLTLHILGGSEMLAAAVKAAREEAKRLKTKAPRLLGVTVLTSQKASPARVLQLAKLGLGCGLDGVVCSVREAAYLRKKIRKKFLIVTPGIRPKHGRAGDQKRIATPGQAIKAGSNFLVIGRPILKASKPALALKEILKN